MTPAARDEPAAVVQPYRLFNVTTKRTERLSPHFVRVTLAGEHVRHFATHGLDQRVKLVFPDTHGEYARFWRVGERSLTTTQWQARWRALPESRRNPLRSYTVSGVRPWEREIDIDFVLHDTPGPASRWAAAASSGDELVVCGPDARAEDAVYGIQWHPGTATRVLLVGDETALPAIRNIVRSLRPHVTGHVLLELPTPADLPLVTWPKAAIDVTVQARQGAAPGSFLPTMAREWVLAHGDRAARMGEGFYSWIAGETSQVAALRRALVHRVGVAPSRVQAQGYWRTGPRPHP